MGYEHRQRQFGWFSRAAILAFAVLMLPMAPGATDSGVAQARGVDDSVQSEASTTRFAWIVDTSPEIGATDVDPSVREITVTFDRDMTAGMSWTGGPPAMPPIDESRKAEWRTKRTCVLPVILEAGKCYRVGINSMSFHNFRSAAGAAAPPAAIYFTTKGATAEVKDRLRAPEIVSLAPANNATDVDPKTEILVAVFNMPMGDGMSWTGGGPDFPKIPEGRKASWSADGRTCVLPVALEPGTDYHLGLNSLSHIGFQNAWGVPLAPVDYKFRTRGGK